MELKTGQFASRIMGFGGVKRLALSIFLHLNADLIGSYANDPNLWIIVSESLKALIFPAFFNLNP